MKILVNNKEQDAIKAIQVDDYWVIVNTKLAPKYLDWCLNNHALNSSSSKYKAIEQCSKNAELNWAANMSYNSGKTFLRDNYHKIIASTKHIEGIPLIVFKERSVEELAIDYLWKYWSYMQCPKSVFINNPNEPIEFKRQFDSFIDGYNQAKSSDKKWSDEDVLSILYDYDNVDWSKREHKQSIIMLREWLQEKLQSLNQSKLPDILNLEMEEVCKYEGACIKNECLTHPCSEKILKLKTISTPEGDKIYITI